MSSHGLQLPLRRMLLFCLCLVAFVWIGHLPVLQAGFLSLPDRTAAVLQPQAAFTTPADVLLGDSQAHAAAVRDFALFGADGTAHAVSIGLHCLNVVMFFLLLQAVFRRSMPALFAAGLFGLHPVHVAATAFAAYQELLLAFFLALVALLACVYFIRKQSLPAYAASLLFFAPGSLLAPRIAVSSLLAPLVLVFSNHGAVSTASSQTPTPSDDTAPRSRNGRSLLYFIGLFLACDIGAGLTAAGIFGPGIAGPVMPEPSTAAHIVHVLTSLTRAPLLLTTGSFPLLMTPAHGFPAFEGAVALLLLFIVTSFCLRMRHKAPEVALGWVWFLLLGAGFFFTGAFNAAGFAYLAFPGLYIALAFGAARLAQRLHLRDVVVTVAAAATLAGFGLLAARQARLWSDPAAVFAAALRAEPGDFVNADALGLILLRRGKPHEALEMFDRAVEKEPGFAAAHNNRGRALQTLGRIDPAVAAHRKALELNPKNPEIYNDLARALFRSGRGEQALHTLLEGLKRFPNSAELHADLGLVYLTLGRERPALDSLRRALELKPLLAKTNYGMQLLVEGRSGKALDFFRRALRLDTVPEE